MIKEHQEDSKIDQTNNFLTKSYKNRFHFKLATTSFIYPDNIIPNVKKVGPFFDELELLLFDSQYDGSLPLKSDIKTLELLSKELNVGYNIHLPTDISITDKDEQDRAIKSLAEAILLTLPLSPSTFTLHLPGVFFNSSDDDILRWQEIAYNGVKKLIDRTGISPRFLSIETLEYPFEIVDPILNEFDLSVCIDLGHLLVFGFDCIEIFDKYKDRVAIIHLHGVDHSNDKRPDHLSLERLSKENMTIIKKVIDQFTKVVSLEIFSFNDLVTSLNFIDRYYF